MSQERPRREESRKPKEPTLEDKLIDKGLIPEGCYRVDSVYLDDREATIIQYHDELAVIETIPRVYVLWYKVIKHGKRTVATALKTRWEACYYSVREGD